MRLTIDIPKQMYLNAKADTLCGADILVSAIKNGRPLDKVLEDIKTEIEECWQMYEERFDVGDCLDIIDKHISGKESK